MTLTLSRMMIAFAAACLGERHRTWGHAMRAELEVAVDAGTPLRFATGCLFSALIRLPSHEEGRFGITAYALALGLLIPMAALQIGCAVFGLPYLFAVDDMAIHDGLRTAAFHAAMPSILAVMLLLGLAHLRLAWMVLERDWSRVTRIGTLTLAAAATLFVVMGALVLDSSQALLQGAVLGIELGAIAWLARWHAELPSPATE